MPRDTVAAVRETIAAGPLVTVIGALDVELACLGSNSTVEPQRYATALSGPGATRARAAALRAIEAGALGLVSWGLAGGLVPELAPGTVLIPQRIVAAGREPLFVDPSWQAAIVAALTPAFPIHRGDLASVDEVIHTPRGKASVAVDLGVVAADMESYAIAAAGLAAGVRVVVVRVVADASADRLPDDVEQWVAADGRRRFAPVLSTLTAPAQWPLLLRLAARYRTASRRLRTLAAVLEPAAFALPERSAAARADT
jgi:adenosylhomocysteine nucleosidase